MKENGDVDTGLPNAMGESPVAVVVAVACVAGVAAPNENMEAPPDPPNCGADEVAVENEKGAACEGAACEDVVCPNAACMDVACVGVASGAAVFGERKEKADLAPPILPLPKANTPLLLLGSLAVVVVVSGGAVVSC